LSPDELNYMVTEKEFLAVIFSINKYRHYITGYEVFIYIDHSTIRYLMNKQLTSERVTSWLLLLHKFNITIIDRLGKSNVVAHYLSRLNNPGEEITIDDDFSDKHLFSVSTKSPWFVDISNYLVTGELPPHLSTREKKNIIQKGVAYS